MKRLCPRLAPHGQYKDLEQIYEAHLPSTLAVSYILCTGMLSVLSGFHALWMRTK